MDLNLTSSNLLSSISLANPGLAANAVFNIERQMMSKWCWAACTVSICKYYNSPQISQKQLVAQVNNKPFCATGPLIPFCNDPADLGDALRAVGHLSASFESQLSEGTMVDSLNARQPVGCQLYLPYLGGGHAVIVYACYRSSDGSYIFRVADPADGALLIMRYQEIQSNYRGSTGRWLRSYTTH